MNYFGNRKINILVGFAIAISILMLIATLTTKSIETSLGGSFNVILGDSSNNLFKNDIFNFTDKGKVSKKILKYEHNPMDTYIYNAQVIDVPFINQTTLYPTGCESVSTTTVLQYYGIDITVDEFIEEHLVTAELKIIDYDKHGKAILSSKDPNEAFIGNPKSAYGLGCYEQTIVNAINSILDEKDLQNYFKVESHVGLTLEEIIKYLDNNIPVIIWATQNMVQSEEGVSWYIDDTDTIFQYIKNEHCLVAIGYDNENLYFNDSLVGRIAYPKELFFDRYTQMGSRTVTIEYLDKSLKGRYSIT